MSKTFPIELSEELHKRLKHAAVDDGMTLHDWIVRALSEKVGGNGSSEKASSERNPSHERRNRNR
jgi:hypothetical protein